MESTFYTFTANEVAVSGAGVRQASGGNQRVVCLRRAPAQPSRPAGGRVIDFAAWQAERGVGPSLPVEEPAPPAELLPEEAAPAPQEGLRRVRRPRRSRASRAAWLLLDLAASLAVIAVAACACVSFFL